MIYLQNTTDLQEVKIPVSVVNPNDALYHFKLTNTINLKPTYDGILRTADFNNDFNADFALVAEPYSTDGGSYYVFTLELPESLENGSYEYVFSCGNKVLSTGVAMVGDFNAENSQYIKDAEYEQYNAE